MLKAKALDNITIISYSKFCQKESGVIHTFAHPELVSVDFLLSKNDSI